ncbi:MAG TPA: DUF5652 family protein [Prolixibacteraceae bacterium]|nr:DUF5652 family protein [Prolixibacteraceae bacterium]
MESLLNLPETFIWVIPILIILIFWEATWKVIAMWKAGRNNHLAWFICIAIFNTIGILPIIYILMNKKNPTAKLDS